MTTICLRRISVQSSVRLIITYQSIHISMRALFLSLFLFLALPAACVASRILFAVGKRTKTPVPMKHWGMLPHG